MAIYPPVYDLCAASAGVKALIGTTPRLYLFGEAVPNVTRPYVVWQTVFGTPENYLGEVPDMDSWGVQVDVYGITAASCRAVAKAMTDALEPVAYVTSWNGEAREPETRDYRFTFTVEFLENRIIS